MYYNVFYTVSGDEKAAVSIFIGGGNVGLVVGISFAVLAVCFVGSVIGMAVSYTHLDVYKRQVHRSNSMALRFHTTARATCLKTCL